MRDSLEPARSLRRPLHVATSLLSAAHTVKPNLGGPDGAPPPRRRPLKFILLIAGSAALGLIGAVGVAHLHARPAPIMQIVSGSPVLKKSTDGDSVRWHANKTTIYLDDSLAQINKSANDTVQLAFGAWLGSGAKLPQISFDSTHGAKFTSTPNGKSEIMYGPITLPGHQNDLALTITFSDPKTGEVLEADMIFNSAHSFSLLGAAQSNPNPPSAQPQNAASGANTSVSTLAMAANCTDKYDLQSVATHEAGHFFGLGEDYDVKTATMYYSTGRCELNKRALLSSDETTMDALYVAGSTDTSSDSSADTGKGCGGARIGQGSTRGGAAWLALFGVFGFVGWRRRRR